MSRTPDQILKKKQELESNLVRIQEDLDKTIDDVRGEVTQNLSPSQIVKKYPLPVVGGAILLGFLIGTPARSRRKGSAADTITGSIGSSLKRRLTKKAVDIAIDVLEEKLSQKKRKEARSKFS